MSAVTWAALSIAAVHLARDADNAFGRFVLSLLACFLFVAGLLAAPWGGVLS